MVNRNSGSVRSSDFVVMKITRRTNGGHRREALLKEYFLTASLLALLKRLGDEAVNTVPRRTRLPVPVRVRE